MRWITDAMPMMLGKQNVRETKLRNEKRIGGRNERKKKKKNRVDLRQISGHIDKYRSRFRERALTCEMQSVHVWR